MATTNPLWGAPRIHGELLKLGIEVSERTVSRWMPKRPKPPSQTWRAFLENHLKDLVSIDFFTVASATFQILFVFVVLTHDRRRVAGLQITEVLIAPRSPWQNPYVARRQMENRTPCYDAAMKKLVVLVSLFGAISLPLAAQDSEPTQVPEPTQTPDVITVPEQTDAPEPAQAPGPLSPLEKALIQSAYDGKLAEVQVLVAKGASVDLADKKKRTPLILAAYNGHTSVVEFLYGKGADINAKDSGGQTALMHTCKRSFNETAAFLLKNGAEVNVQSRKKGVTALMITAVAGNVELVRMLLDRGADANLTDVFGNTAKILAEKKGNSAVVDLLSEPPASG